MPPPITSFTGSHAFLSNFYSSNVSWEGKSYPTLEHAFQAAKTFDVTKRTRISQAPSPSAAKRIGRSLPFRNDWEEVKDDVMYFLLRNKFDLAGRPKLAYKLAQTAPRVLMEGNGWGDTYWGVEEKSLQGKNRLGELLMVVRKEISSGIRTLRPTTTGKI
jgi:ribA/ribD-fused uncharacterized protein